jgi:hypothetical protein
MKGKSTEPDAWSFICRTCGVFRITQELLDLFAVSAGGKDFPFYKFSYEFRNRSEGLKVPALVPVQTTKDVQPIVQSADPTVEAKLERLLSMLAHASRYPGDKVYFDQASDYPLSTPRIKTKHTF